MELQFFTVSPENITLVAGLLKSTLRDKKVDLYGFDDERYLHQFDYDSISQWDPYEGLTVSADLVKNEILNSGKVYRDSEPAHQGPLLVLGDEVIVNKEEVVCIHKKSSELVGRKTTWLKLQDTSSQETVRSALMAAA